MFQLFNTNIGASKNLYSSTTLTDLKNYLESLTEGFYWSYVSDIAMRTFTGVSNLGAGVAEYIVIDANNILCEIRDFQGFIGNYVLYKRAGVWSESFAPRNG